jgi:hypothetical protein
VVGLAAGTTLRAPLPAACAVPGAVVAVAVAIDYTGMLMMSS